VTEDLAILYLMRSPGIGPRTLCRLLGHLRAANVTAVEFLRLPAGDRAEDFDLKPEIAASIESSNSEAELLYAALEAHAVRMLVIGADDYPKRLNAVLGDTAPPVLFVRGNLELLEVSAAGFCGSRKASAKGLEIAAETAGLLARRGVNIVSGYAGGVDLAAHTGALSSGGATTFVLATGILHYTQKSAVAGYLSDDNHLVISEFSPRLGWSAHNAMQRNHTIVGLTDLMVLVESGMTGGTFEAGKVALRHQHPLYVVAPGARGDTAAGNVYFLERGARPLMVEADDPVAVDELITVLDEGQIETRQTNLFP